MTLVDFSERSNSAACSGRLQLLLLFVRLSKRQLNFSSGMNLARVMCSVIRYSAFEMPPAERLSEETFAELEKAHSDLLSVLGEQ